MTLRRLIKLISKYGLYRKYKCRGGWAVDWWHGDDVFVNYSDNEFVCINCLSDDGDTDVYSLERFSFYDYKKDYVIKRKKDIIKKYGNVGLATVSFYKEEKRYKEQQKKLKKQARKKIKEYKKRKRQEKKNGRTK